MATTQSQTFYIDPNSVNNSGTVFVTSVDLYFSAKPTLSNTPSGVTSPSVTISLSDTDASNAPVYDKGYTQSILSLPLASINVDVTGAIPTTFTFNQPIPLDTGKVYSINIQMADPGYAMWYAKKGDKLYGTNVAFGGFSGGHQGQLFDYGNNGNLTPIQNTQLKFTVKVAKFTSNTATYEIVNDGFEFLNVQSQKKEFIGGEGVFPILANVSAQTISYSTTSANVVGTGTTFTSQFIPGSYIVSYATATQLTVAQVNSVIDDTHLTLKANAAFTNSTANFYKAPVGNVYFTNMSSNTLILTRSTANSTLYFKSYPVVTGNLTTSNVTINNISTNVYAAGIFVGQPVYANVNGIPAATTVAAIVNASAINVSTAFTGTTTSQAALYFLTPLVGAISGANAYLGAIYPYPVNSFIPEIGVNLPSGGNAALSYAFAQSNATAVFVNSSASAFSTTVNNRETKVTAYNGFVLSRSVEVQNPSTMYGSNTKSSVIKVNLTQAANNTAGIFSSPYIYSEKLDIFSVFNSINFDLTNENTGYGNTKAKHVTTKISFDPTYSAQDLLVQASAFMPIGTTIVAYAKLYNSTDGDSFNTKQWTQLVPIVPTGSTADNSTVAANNYIPLSFGLPNMPPSSYTANGTVTIGVAYSATANATVTGIATNFANTTNSAEIKVNDVVRIWNPIVPTAFQVAVVTSIANATSLTLNTTVANTSILGQPGFFIDKVSNPYTAYTDPQNYNTATYYNSGLTALASYDTMQIKMNMLSVSTNIVPRIGSLTAVGLSS